MDITLLNSCNNADIVHALNPEEPRSVDMDMPEQQQIKLASWYLALKTGHTTTQTQTLPHGDCNAHMLCMLCYRTRKCSQTRAQVGAHLLLLLHGVALWR